MTMHQASPSPDYLLQTLQAQERAQQRGKLRIYFGAVAGVGKTYAMLQAAKEVQAEGVKVLVGVVETHGRAGTEAQVAGLTLLPKKEWLFQGKPVMDFDLDAAIAAQPGLLLLLDELAHSNVAGARHPKRWQDVAELLDLGIDVWTTLNVQHLESLNGVIEHITGVPIQETVPDAFFDSANEIVLVDTTAEELTKRLGEGQIYAPAQAQRAQQHFFRKGNLISLREIALRRTAECIEADVKTHRQREAIQSVWQTDAGVLVCLSGGASDEHLVRSGARLAGQLGGEWHVLFVDTPIGQKAAQLRQAAAMAQLRFAERLGAQTAYAQSEKAVPSWVAYAREHNLAHLMCLAESRRWPWQQGVAQSIRALAPEINVVHVGGVDPERARPAAKPAHVNQGWQGERGGWPRLRPYVLTLVASLALALVLYPLADVLDNANIIMLFLVLVVGMSVRYGRSVGVFASVISVALFDFGFVMPRHSFAVGDVQYLITFVVMLGVGLLTGQYALHLKLRARTANRREQQAVSLFAFAKNLSGQLEFDEIIRQSQAVLLQEFKGQVAFLLPDLTEQLHLHQPAPEVNLQIAQWAYLHQKEAGFGTDTLPKHGYLYVPLKAPIRIRGILALAPDDPESLWLPEKRRQLDVLASLIALTLERIHFAAVAQQATMGIASEQMRNTLLATISHDLRTPLTALMGESEWLAQTHQQLPAAQVGQSLTAIHDCAQRLFAMVSNLLEMARLQSDEFALNKEWHSMEELIGSVTCAALFAHPDIRLETKVPADCPLVECDGVLIERVLSNLLDNAIKYSAAPAQVSIEVKVLPQWLQVSVLDQGSGIAPEHVAELFEKFSRGEKESHNVGTGLGLSIAKTIVTAHAGRIDAALRSDKPGSHFWFTLPLRPAPSIE